jgi:hypothetical protein
MVKLLGSFVATLFFVAAPAEADLFELSNLTVAAHSSEPGLVLYSNNRINQLPRTFELNSVGASETFALFELGTNENALNGDDLIPYEIAMNFQFALPAPAFGGAAAGLTGWFFRNFGYVLAFGSSG